MIDPTFVIARRLLQDFKGPSYIYGLGVLPETGRAARRLGTTALFVRDSFPGSERYLEELRTSLASSGVQVLAELDGARPNAPREDLARITAALSAAAPDLLISFGGGSTLDAAKAAAVLVALGDSVEEYFGAGLVTTALATRGRSLLPHFAIQTAASSGAHLTKYANITDLSTGQKKLIVDEAIVPVQPVFDYRVTFDAPRDLTADGALDGLSHALEVLYGATGKPNYALIAEVAETAIRLIVSYLPVALAQPGHAGAREALGLATDLGGYAIMIGGTNGAHLTSFSLVDVLSHGRACAIMNPYYTVFFAPAIQSPLALVAGIFEEAGYMAAGAAERTGRELGVAVAQAMMDFQARIGFPTRLSEVPGFSTAHITRALAAAKNPQLKSKLENMPVALTADQVDAYMGPVLAAAETGNLALIRNLQAPTRSSEPTA